MRYLALASLCVAATSVWAQSGTVDSYIATESPVAKQNLLANIGSQGSQSHGAKPGVVIASPAQVYLYTWTRDSSLVFKLIIDQYTLGLDNTLRTQIDNFVAAQKIIQQISNPSGTVTSGGLGEPKFNIDETAFTGAWGRPQRDGPALRATALITYANWLLNNGNSSYVTNTLWPIIQLDLNYVSGNWNQSTFDLWEEVRSSSFFTTAVQHRALREGALLATAIGQTSVVPGYTQQANSLLCFLQSYWNPSGGYITANTGGGRSGKDANTVLASIHTFDATAICDAATFQPCSDKALANLLVYVNAFRSVYAIDSGASMSQAVATGRYPEDNYQGGNPWYLTTLAVAEQLYDALIVWTQQGNLNVTSTSLPFFRLFAPNVVSGSYASTTPTFITLTSAIKTYADGFVSVVAHYTPSGGGLAEQFSRSNGAPASVNDLTWSYAAALTAFDARAGVVPASWGAAGLSVCGSSSTSTTSTTTTTTSTSTTSTTTTTTTTSAAPSGSVSVTFNVVAQTVYGENIFLTGSIPALQNWSPNNALALSPANYPTWSVTVVLPANTAIQYKYIRKNNGKVTWEADPNMQLTTPASGTFVENDTFR